MECRKNQGKSLMGKIYGSDEEESLEELSKIGINQSNHFNEEEERKQPSCFCWVLMEDQQNWGKSVKSL